MSRFLLWNDKIIDDNEVYERYFFQENSLIIDRIPVSEADRLNEKLKQYEDKKYNGEKKRLNREELVSFLTSEGYGKYGFTVKHTEKTGEFLRSFIIYEGSFWSSTETEPYKVYHWWNGEDWTQEYLSKFDDVESDVWVRDEKYVRISDLSDLEIYKATTVDGSNEIQNNVWFVKHLSEKGESLPTGEVIYEYHNMHDYLEGMGVDADSFMNEIEKL